MWPADLADVQGIRRRMNNKEDAPASRNGHRSSPAGLASRCRAARDRRRSGSIPVGAWTQILDINFGQPRCGRP